MKITTRKKVFSALTAICCSCSLLTAVSSTTNNNNILFNNAIVAEAATLSGTKVASAGTTLTCNEKYISPNGKYVVIFETSGNLVVSHYNKTTSQVGNTIWSSRTAGNNLATCTFQSNGNLVINKKATLWDSRTSGKGGAYLYLMDDGELRIVSSDKSSIIWGTYHNSNLLSAHFRKEEFICPCGCNGVKYDQELIDKLEQLYTKLNCSKIIVKSGYRCPTYSATVSGGFSTDGHTRGIAATVVCYNSSGAVIPCEDVAWAAEQVGFNGIGLFHNNEIHLDVRNGVNYTNAHWFGDDRTGNNNIATFKNYSINTTLNINWNELKKVGRQPSGSYSCSCYALAYARTILDGKARTWYTYNLYGSNQRNVCAVWSRGAFGVEPKSTTKEGYQLMYDQIKAGKPVIVLVESENGNRSTQHYVTVIGVSPTANRNNLSPQDFTIIDPAVYDGSRTPTPENMWNNCNNGHYRLKWSSSTYIGYNIIIQK